MWLLYDGEGWGDQGHLSVLIYCHAMMATRGEQVRLPWGAAVTTFACVVHAAAILVYAAVFFGLANTELRWQGVEQVPRWCLGSFAGGVVGSHAVVAFGPVFSERWSRSVLVHTVRAVVAVICAVSLVFVVLMVPFAAASGAEWEGWALMGCLGISAAIVLASLMRGGVGEGG